MAALVGADWQEAWPRVPHARAHLVRASKWAAPAQSNWLGARRPAEFGPARVTRNARHHEQR